MKLIAVCGLLDKKSAVYIAPFQRFASPSEMQITPEGQVAEWFKAHAWNACVRESVPWVRIPPCPPEFLIFPREFKDLKVFQVAGGNTKGYTP
jgi:hypothetical protein